MGATTRTTRFNRLSPSTASPAGVPFVCAYADGLPLPSQGSVGWE